MNISLISQELQNVGISSLNIKDDSTITINDKTMLYLKSYKAPYIEIFEKIDDKFVFIHSVSSIGKAIEYLMEYT